jgi:IMP dehydrogenase
MVHKIIGYNPNGPSRTFREFSLLTGLTTRECTIDKVSLETRLADNLVLDYPFIPAAMRSVTGLEMAMAAARNGFFADVPCSLSIDEQCKIIRQVKNEQMDFITNPVTAYPTDTIDSVLKKVEEYGYSTIPIIKKDGTFVGMFHEDDVYVKSFDKNRKVREVMVSFTKNGKINYCPNSVSLYEVKKLFINKEEMKYIVILDGRGRLDKLAFKQDLRERKIGAAISTHEDWRERAEATIDAGADIIMTDTSDGYTVFLGEIIKEYKKDKRFRDIPICGGNFITKEGFLYCAERGMDIAKIGMGIGSMCSTQGVKATGRGQFTAVEEIYRARNEFLKKTGRYIPIIADGGIEHTGEMIIALTRADALMMGRYFNRFWEAEGNALDRFGNIVKRDGRIRYKRRKDESTPNHLWRITRSLLSWDRGKIVKKEIWGEGSRLGRNIARYGHKKSKTFFEEGVVGTVDYAGRLKPNVEKDALKIKAALSNTGCRSLREFREKAVIQRLSSQALREAGIHGLLEYEK